MILILLLVFDACSWTVATDGRLIVSDDADDWRFIGFGASDGVDALCDEDRFMVKFQTQTNIERERERCMKC